MINNFYYTFARDTGRKRTVTWRGHTNYKFNTVIT